ncbi:MAG: sugar transferase [Christensenellales bacterium]
MKKHDEKTKKIKSAPNCEDNAQATQKVGDEQFINDFKVRKIFAYPFFKRAFDIGASFLAIIILAIPMIFVAIAIKIDSKGHAFYASERVGKGGKIFRLYKYRSMDENADEKLNELLKERHDEWEVNFKLKNDPRITKLGKFLRKTSIDELPQLFNILKGDMSFVGPRPCSLREYDSYTEKDKLRLSVPQGLTGEWQTHGRSNTTIEQRIDMDLDYIQNKRGFFYDLYLIFKTIGVAFRQEGAE